MKTKTTICVIDEQDDDESAATLLKRYFPELEIDFHSHSPEQALAYLNKTIPDILLIDVKITNQKTYDLITGFSKSSSQIIFITESEQFAIQALRNGATDHLLKPVKSLEFVIKVKKAIEKFSKTRIPILPRNYQDKINLPTIQGFKRVDICEIIRCEADSCYTFIYLADKTKIIVSKTLHDFENYLSGYNFYRIHHKHLINLGHLKEYIKGKGGQVIMADNSILDVSVRKKNDFLYTLENTV